MAGGGSKPGQRRGGRQRGSSNKTTANAKEAIELAFEGIGGVKTLTAWANDNQGDFFKLVFPKLMPLQVNHADNEGNRLVIEWAPPSDA
jgi:hypothetical protein